MGKLVLQAFLLTVQDDGGLNLPELATPINWCKQLGCVTAISPLLKVYPLCRMYITLDDLIDHCVHEQD